MQSGKDTLKSVKCFIKQKLTPAVHFIFIPHRKEAAADSCSRHLVSYLRQLVVSGQSYMSVYGGHFVNLLLAGSQHWKHLLTFIILSSVQRLSPLLPLMNHQNIISARRESAIHPSKYRGLYMRWPVQDFLTLTRQKHIYIMQIYKLAQQTHAFYFKSMQKLLHDRHFRRKGSELMFQ